MAGALGSSTPAGDGGDARSAERHGHGGDARSAERHGDGGDARSAERLGDGGDARSAERPGDGGDAWSAERLGDGGDVWSAERLGDGDGPALAVFIHGGFWRARFDAGSIASLAQAAADLGLWSWNLEYPRVGMAGGGWPGTALAVREAIAAAVAAAGERPVIVLGHSAGGQLALWAVRDQGVALVVSLAGVCDLEAGATAGLGNGAVEGFLGRRPDRDLLAAASPLQRLPLGVPTLLIHGDADLNVPVQQSRAYLDGALASGDRCELVELPGADHFELVDRAGRAWPIIAERLGALAAG